MMSRTDNACQRIINCGYKDFQHLGEIILFLSFPTTFGFHVSLSFFVCTNMHTHRYVCILRTLFYVKREVLSVNIARTTQKHYVNLHKLLSYPQLTPLRSSSVARINFSLAVQMDTRKASRCIVANQTEAQQGN